MARRVSKMRFSKAVVFASLGGLLVACGGDEPAPTGVGLLSDPLVSVATVGEGHLSLAEVRDYLNSRPFGQGQMVTEQTLQDRVEEMVTAEVLFQEALRLKLDQHPEMRRNLRLLLAQRLLAEQVDKPVLTREITEEELKAYFEQHRMDYTRPLQYRLADIFIAVETAASKAEKSQKLELAQDILRKALDRKDERFNFATLVTSYSDKHPAYAIGDTGFFDIDGNPIGIDSALTSAAFSLQRDGEVFPEVVTTAAGYHVIMRVGSRAAVEKNYSDLKEDLDQRIRREELDSLRRAYVDEIRARADIEIDAALISRLVDEVQGSVGDKARPDSSNPNYPPALEPQQ